jgi:outer membrane protein OmpA-like peptidoglycan-associated protein
MFGGYVEPSATAGIGIAFRLNDRINIALEDRAIFVANDVVDGMLTPYWSNQGKDWYNYGTLGLNFNLGNKAKRVEPLYWLNPLSYLYSEVRRTSDIILIDSDGDGVIDQFDQEQTPPGCPVDTHGVSLDTDGDGVPDCRDKELITPTYCQPVDADGVGKCPCPEDCKVVAPVTECSTSLGVLPSLSFGVNSNTLSADAQYALASVAARMRSNPGCKVVVVGYCADTKRQQQLSWDHVNKVITHLVEKEGISSDRFIFSSGQQGGDCNTVDLRAAAPGEYGPNTVAPPHPNLRKN